MGPRTFGLSGLNWFDHIKKMGGPPLIISRSDPASDAKVAGRRNYCEMTIVEVLLIVQPMRLLSTGKLSLNGYETATVTVQPG